jgi:hypothetical protein
MSVSYVKIFNQLIDEFFIELINIFPEEPKIKVRHTMFQTLVKANAKRPCVEFMTKSMPYLEKIAMRDDQFFTGADKPFILDALNFEGLWRSGISENTKKAIWKYIQSFFAIGIHVVEIPPEARDIIDYIIKYEN